VFFWPGTESKLSEYGQRHSDRYAGEDVAMLRIPTADLLRHNQRDALFCRYDSGSNGRPSSRGRNLFSDCGSFEGTASDVVEVVFEGSAQLPDSTELNSANGWTAVA
jgi:hypothetical protein